MIEIKNSDGTVLYTAQDAGDIRRAMVEAVSTGADLTGANLAGADLTGADLTRADLTRADLTRAYLAGAKGIHARRVDDLLILLDQPGPIRAYKLVTAEGSGPYNGGIEYVVGEEVSVDDANTDPGIQCGPGINVATMPWCLRLFGYGMRILVVEFTAADIAAIPLGTDGKFRLHRCKVVDEIPAEKIREWLGASA